MFDFYTVMQLTGDFALCKKKKKSDVLEKTSIIYNIRDSRLHDIKKILNDMQYGHSCFANLYSVPKYFQFTFGLIP